MLTEYEKSRVIQGICLLLATPILGIVGCALLAPLLGGAAASGLACILAACYLVRLMTPP